jgi:hypothetical protein
MTRAAASAALALLLCGPAASAAARGNDWQTIVKVSRGKVQACKVPTTEDGPWKVKLRVNARKATTSVRGIAQVDKNNHALDRTWKTGWIDPGQVSKVGSVRLPRGSAYTLEVGIDSGSAGSGAALSARSIGRC